MALDTTEDGRVVGRVAFDNYGLDTRGFIFDGAKTETLPLLEGHTRSTASAINAAGIIVGESRTPRAAVVWQDGEVRSLAPTLGTPASIAHDINDDGYVAGWRGTNAIYDARGFLLNLVTDEVVDVGVLPNGSSGVPRAVNNRRVIVGTGWRPDLQTTLSFLWSSGRIDRAWRPPWGRTPPSCAT